MFHCPNHYGDCLQSGLYSKSQYPSLAFLVKYIVGVRYFISILCVVSMIWFCVDGIKLDTRNNYFMGGKWEQSANVNQMCGYAKHVTHIMLWRTIVKNYWLAKLSFDIFVKFRYTIMINFSLLNSIETIFLLGQIVRCLG